MTESRINILLDLSCAYLDDRLTAEQATQLDVILQEDAEALALFTDQIEIHYSLKRHHHPQVTVASMPQPKRHSRILAWAASLILLSALSLFLFHRHQEGVASIALLDSGEPLKRDALLTHNTESIRFTIPETGVNVQASPPYTLQLKSPSHLYLTEGEVQVTVPPAGKGFIVETADHKVIDLGTEFIVSKQAQETQVLVLSGKVVLQHKQTSQREHLVRGDLKKYTNSAPGGNQTGNTAQVDTPGTARDTLTGRIFTAPAQASFHTSDAFKPLLNSKFQHPGDISSLIEGTPHPFRGIVGNTAQLPTTYGLKGYPISKGWVAWYSGMVQPPRSGKFRFWGKADNHLLVAINGEIVLEGAYQKSPFRSYYAQQRQDHAEFRMYELGNLAYGEWIDVGNTPVKIDILLGENDNRKTHAILMIEEEGQKYALNRVGQPAFPLFLIARPSLQERKHFLDVKAGSKGRGSFSVDLESLWMAVK